MVCKIECVPLANPWINRKITLNANSIVKVDRNNCDTMCVWFADTDTNHSEIDIYITVGDEPAPYPGLKPFGVINCENNGWNDGKYFSVWVSDVL